MQSDCRHGRNLICIIIEPVTITFLFELTLLKCICLQRGYFGLIKKYQSAQVQIAVAEIKTLNCLQISSLDRDFLLVRHFCFAFFERNPYFFFAQPFSLNWLLHGTYTVPLDRHNMLSLLKT